MTARDLRLSRWAAGQLLMLALFLAGHLGAFVWWTGRITAEVRTLRERVGEALADPYRASDASRDLGRLEHRFEEVARRLEGDRQWQLAWEQRLSRLEARREP
jgi:hypothetical protein